jgi:RNA polymerase sigma-70 factor (ECF subfamily)
LAEQVIYRNEDTVDFTILYQQYFEKVYRYHVSRTGNVHDAQDLTSETFKTAYENMHRYRGDGSWGGWLFGIAHHKMADHFRRQNDHLEEFDEQFIQLGTDAETLAFQNIQAFQVYEKLNSLPPERAEALRLRFWGGLTASEAAKVMGKSEAAVKMLVFRGVHDLRAVFSNEEQEVR